MHSIEGRRCLVLGASGFLGRWVARELLRRGAIVGAHARAVGDPKGLDGPAESLEADLSVEGSASSLVRSFRPDVVFDLAGYGVARDQRDERRAERINVGVVSELVETLPAAGSDWPGAVLVLPGSALELGPRPDSMDESAPAAPTTTYGRTKLAATRIVDDARNRGVAGLTARVYTVYGPGEHPGRLVPTLCAALENEEPIALSEGLQERDWAYAEDVARLLVDLACVDGRRLLSREPPFDAPCINLACGRLTSVRDFVLLFAEEFGIAQERLAFGEVPGLAEEMFHPPVPVERLRAALGEAPPADPRVGLAALHRRLAQEGVA